MLSRNSRLLAGAMASGWFLVAGGVQAAACVSADFVGLNSLAGSCYGTSADSTVRFMPTDPLVQFSTSGGYTGEGTFTTPVIQQPGGVTFGLASAFGTHSSRGSITGVAPGGSASASTSSDLRTGALKLSGSVNSDELNPAIANGFYAIANLADLLTILVPKALDHPTIIFNLDVDGVIGGSGVAGGSPGIVQAGLLMTSLDGTISYRGSPDFQANALGSYADTLSIAIASLQGAEDLGDAWLLSVQLDASLFAIGDPNYSFDFSNTAQLRFELSDGITFTSGSGVLLAGPQVSAVPEPSTALLAFLAFGVFLAGGTSWRKAGVPPVL